MFPFSVFFVPNSICKNGERGPPVVQTGLLEFFSNHVSVFRFPVILFPLKEIEVLQMNSLSVTCFFLYKCVCLFISVSVPVSVSVSKKTFAWVQKDVPYLQINCFIIWEEIQFKKKRNGFDTDTLATVEEIKKKVREGNNLKLKFVFVRLRNKLAQEVAF